MDITTALRDGKRPERIVELCFAGDLRAEHEAAAAELERLDRTDLVAPSLVSGGKRREVAARIEELEQRMLADSVRFRVRGVGRRAWTKLLAEHPPREGNDSDRGLGVNMETFFDAIVRASVIEPQLTDEQWGELLDDALTDAQFQALADAAWAVNRGSVDVPFSPAASRVVTSSGRE